MHSWVRSVPQCSGFCRWSLRSRTLQLPRHCSRMCVPPACPNPGPRTPDHPHPPTSCIRCPANLRHTNISIQLEHQILIRCLEEHTHTHTHKCNKIKTSYYVDHGFQSTCEAVECTKVGEFCVVPTPCNSSTYICTQSNQFMSTLYSGRPISVCTLWSGQLNYVHSTGSWFNYPVGGNYHEVSWSWNSISSHFYLGVNWCGISVWLEDLTLCVHVVFLYGWRISPCVSMWYFCMVGGSHLLCVHVVFLYGWKISPCVSMWYFCMVGGSHLVCPCGISVWLEDLTYCVSMW